MDEVKQTVTTEAAGVTMMKRDGETYVALGIFIAAVGLPVLAGTYWAVQTSYRGAVVNACCGVSLLIIGVISMAYGRLLVNRSRRRT